MSKNFGMNCNLVEKQEADIRFKHTQDYILNSNGITEPNAFAITDLLNSSNVSVANNVITYNHNWRYSVITFSKLAFDEYASYHSDSECFELMRSTANHEIGHAPGLAHDTRDSGIIMYGPQSHSSCAGYQYDIDDATAVVPTLHDLMAVYLLYQ